MKPVKLKEKHGHFVLSLLFVMFLALVNPSAAVADDVVFPVAGTPSISGVNQVGYTLTAYSGNWSPAPTSFTYQWRRDGMAINFATDQTYSLTGDDYLRSISVTVTASRVGYIATSRTSSSIFISFKGDLPGTPDPRIEGTLTVGEYLFAIPGSYPPPVTITYQWQANFVNIPNAVSEIYRLQPTDKNKTISLRITVSKYGYNELIKTVTVRELVKPAKPKMTWQYNANILTGKNTIKASASYSFGSTDRITTWCLKKNGVPLDLPLSTKGVYFTDTSNRVLTALRLGTGCYTSYTDDLINLAIRVDVTDWTIGSHSLEATVEDVRGQVSAPTSMSIAVGKTAPNVNANFANLATTVKDHFSITATTSTHSSDAPIKRWCVTIDGLAVFKFNGATLTNNSGQLQDKNYIAQSAGCVFSTDEGAVLSAGDLILDSKQFTNGSHELGIRVMSQDSEGTTWWSDEVKTSFKIKNPYIPTVAWNSASKKVTPKGSASKIGGVVSANIPGSPSKVTLSAQTDSGDWYEFASIDASNNFSGSAKFNKNTKVQIEIFDEDNLSVLTEQIDIKVSPVVKLAKPRVVLTGSTISDKITKTVTVSATSPGLSASCTAKWSGGSARFAMKAGKGAVTFRPGGSGKVWVVCSAANMAPSTAVAAKY